MLPQRHIKPWCRSAPPAAWFALHSQALSPEAWQTSRHAPCQAGCNAAVAEYLGIWRGHRPPPTTSYSWSRSWGDTATRQTSWRREFVVRSCLQSVPFERDQALRRLHVCAVLRRTGGLSRQLTSDRFPSTSPTGCVRIALYFAYGRKRELPGFGDGAGQRVDGQAQDCGQQRQ